jgi:hypothetical protein
MRQNAIFEESLETNIFTFCIGMVIVGTGMAVVELIKSPYTIIKSPYTIYKYIKLKKNNKKKNQIQPKLIIYK